MKIKIKVQSNELELDPQEARELYESLDILFGKNKSYPVYIPLPNTIISEPYHPPYWQQPVWGSTCGTLWGLSGASTCQSSVS
jgi:hypothetical protein